jgi:hypothetical protein
VEEYDATIGKLQKELLMKEKQITFYIKVSQAQLDYFCKIYYF